MEEEEEATLLVDAGTSVLGYDVDQSSMEAVENSVKGDGRKFLVDMLVALRSLEDAFGSGLNRTEQLIWKRLLDNVVPHGRIDLEDVLGGGILCQDERRGTIGGDGESAAYVHLEGAVEPQVKRVAAGVDMAKVDIHIPDEPVLCIFFHSLVTDDWREIIGYRSVVSSSGSRETDIPFFLRFLLLDGDISAD